jgi:hypothetical protein
MVVAEQEFDQAVESSVNGGEQWRPLPGLAETGRTNLVKEPLDIEEPADLAVGLDAITASGVQIIGHDNHISCLNVASITSHSVRTKKVFERRLPPGVTLLISLLQSVTSHGGKVAD